MPRLQKRMRVACPCRVCTQECLMEQESIQCDGCDCWFHQHCIGMATAQYLKFSETHLQSFCRHYIGNGDGFNFCSSLACIVVCACDVGKMKAMAESERNLVHFYKISLPQVVHVSGKDATAHEKLISALTSRQLSTVAPPICLG